MLILYVLGKGFTMYERLKGKRAHKKLEVT